MQNTNNPYNKSYLVAGITTIIIGLVLGIGVIMFNLNKYLTNVNKYTSNDKIALEREMTSNDTEYDSYVTEIESLKIEKQTLQKELSELPKTSNNSTKYLELEKKIDTINTRLEELEKLKYSSLTKKNNLRKNYNEVLDYLEKKDSPKGIIKCYLVGFAIIIVSITTSAYLIHLAFQPDEDYLVLKKQLEIDNANKKSTSKVLEEATNKVLAEMSSPKEVFQETKRTLSSDSNSSSKSKTNTSKNHNNYKNNKTTSKNNNYHHPNQNNKKSSNSKKVNNSKNTTGPKKSE